MTDDEKAQADVEDARTKLINSLAPPTRELLTTALAVAEAVSIDDAISAKKLGRAVNRFLHVVRRGTYPLDRCCETCDGLCTPLHVKVCHSAAGYYVGQWCPVCGPYSRLSEEYWPEFSAAMIALADGTYTLRLHV